MKRSFQFNTESCRPPEHDGQDVRAKDPVNCVLLRRPKKIQPCELHFGQNVRTRFPDASCGRQQTDPTLNCSNSENNGRFLFSMCVQQNQNVNLSKSRSRSTHGRADTAKRLWTYGPGYACPWTLQPVHSHGSTQIRRNQAVTWNMSWKCPNFHSVWTRPESNRSTDHSTHETTSTHKMFSGFFSLIFTLYPCSQWLSGTHSAHQSTKTGYMSARFIRTNGKMHSFDTNQRSSVTRTVPYHEWKLAYFCKNIVNTNSVRRFKLFLRKRAVNSTRNTFSKLPPHSLIIARHLSDAKQCKKFTQ